MWTHPNCSSPTEKDMMGVLLKPKLSSHTSGKKRLLSVTFSPQTIWAGTKGGISPGSCRWGTASI
jgi:hypothetical protein